MALMIEMSENYFHHSELELFRQDNFSDYNHKLFFCSSFCTGGCCIDTSLLYVPEDLIISCLQCNEPWYICENCSVQSEFFYKKEQLICHLKRSHKHKLATRVLTFPLQCSNTLDNMSSNFDMFQRNASKMYFQFEKQGLESTYLVSYSQFQLPDATHVVS